MDKEAASQKQKKSIKKPKPDSLKPKAIQYKEKLQV